MEPILYSAELVLKTAYEQAAGIDIPMESLELVNKFNNVSYFRIDTGTKIALPNGVTGLLTFRSGVTKRFAEAGMPYFCSLGIIDSDYRGVLQFYFGVIAEEYIDQQYVAKILGEYPLQLVPLVLYANRELQKAYIEVNTARGSQGFGSSVDR